MTSRLRELSDEMRQLEARLREGGGADRIAKQHKQGKLTARERIAGLTDPGSRFIEIGLLVAHDQYDDQAPGAGVVTGIGIVDGRELVVVANDATVKAGSWWPETIKKILRAQEIAMRCRVPIVYLVDSAGVNLPYQGGVFPGQYGAARIFYYNSIMRRYLKVPQISQRVRGQARSPQSLRTPTDGGGCHSASGLFGESGLQPSRDRASHQVQDETGLGASCREAASCTLRRVFYWASAPSLPQTRIPHRQTATGNQGIVDDR